MVVCELDKEVSGEILGWKIPAWQALLIHRVLPSCGGLVIYLIVVCYDFTLVYQHFQKGDKALGIFCLILMVLPAILSLVFTLASPPPGLQTEMSAFSVTIKNNDIRWIFEEISRALFFPIAAIGRYCYLIFWWIEAVYASREQDEERTREALSQARAPSSMELYLFLQAFIHCAPHAIINILDMMARYANPDIPRRIPRSYMRGLEPQDATAALVNFLGWYAFFIARLLSIAAFIDFFPFVAIIILMSHYQVMLLFLIVPQASTVKRAFYVFLAFIYLFCLMEFKIRFRHVRVWHMFWIIVCTVEIVVFISLWASIDNKLHNWWRSYIVIVTTVSMVLSYLLFLVYFLLLQPRETVVYTNKINIMK